MLIQWTHCYQSRQSFSLSHPGYATHPGHHVSVPELQTRQKELQTHRGKIKCFLPVTLHGCCRSREEKSRGSSERSRRCHYRSASTFSKPSQKLVATTRSFPSSSLCWWVKYCILTGLGRARTNSLARLPVLHRGQRAGRRWPSWGAVEPGRGTRNHETGMARETGPYEWDGVQGSAEKLCWRGSFTAPQMLLSGFTNQIKSSSKVSLLWMTVNSLALHRQTAGSFYLSVCISHICML